MATTGSNGGTGAQFAGLSMPVTYYESRADGGYAWYVNYDLSFDGSNFLVNTRIDLTGANPGTTQATWEQGIERIWNGKAALQSGTDVYGIRVDVSFVDSTDAHYQVNVHSGYGASNMLDWYLQTDWGPSYQDELAAHEYGHMIGMFDQYAGGATYGGQTQTGTIMADLGGTVTLDSFFSIDRYAEQLTGRTFEIVTAATLPPSQPAINTVQGTAASESLTGTAGADLIIGGEGKDELSGLAGFDTLQGGNGDDILRGQDGDDKLYGGAGNDMLYGGNGNDWLWGDAGRDTMKGNAGADTFAFSRGCGSDRVVDFNVAEGDRLAFNGMGYTVTQASDGAFFSFGGGDQVLVAGLRKSDITAAYFV